MKKTTLAYLCPLLIVLLPHLVACQPKSHDDQNHDEANHNKASQSDQRMTQDQKITLIVSNQPLLLLSNEVTKGTKTTVKTLLNAGDVGHHASLSPSDIKAIQSSRHIVWFGKGLESNLANALTKAPHLITLLDDENITLLNKRTPQTAIIQDTQDPHVWLEPENAKAIVNLLANLHASINPKMAKTYQQNAQIFAEKLDSLVKKYKNSSATNQYWSSHDAFQYLEKSLNITLAGTLTTDHETPAKASQMVWLKNNRPYPKMCLLVQNEPKKAIKEQLAPITSKVLNEDLSGSDGYLEMWEKSAILINDCLQGR